MGAVQRENQLRCDRDNADGDERDGDGLISDEEIRHSTRSVIVGYLNGSAPIAPVSLPGRNSQVRPARSIPFECAR